MPTRAGRPDGCAPAASGHAATAPPRSVMNSRRLIVAPRGQNHAPHRLTAVWVLEWGKGDANCDQLFWSGGNPSGGRPGSRHRQQLNGEFIAALLRDFRHGGPKAIERVRRTQPAAYLKILALLVPREHKVEHSNLIKELTDEQLEAMIEYIETSLAAQAGAPAKMIEGTIEPKTATAHAAKPKNRLMLEADTAVGPRERIPRKMRPPAGE